MEALQKRLLALLYEEYVKSPSSWCAPESADVGGAADKEIVYAMKRLKGDGLVEGQYVGRDVWAHAKITARGIEALRDLGVATFLDGDGQYRILKALFEADRESPGYGGLGADDVQALGVPFGVQLTCYLASAGLAKTDHASGADFYNARITDYGIARHEAYARDGSHKVSTTSPTDGTQLFFGPDEEKAAADFFREVVEVARTEVVIVDRYARAPIIALLRHVPPGVKVRVLTSDEHNSSYQPDSNLKALVEVRVVPGKTFAFHDRFVVVDGKDGYSWGHSFHDAGKTRHSVSELRPINREAVLKPVAALWPTAKKVFG